jgi:hypothetical protein
MSRFRFFLLIGMLSVLRAEDSGLSVVHIQSFEYPLLALLADKQGDVEIILSVGHDGAVHSTKVVSGNRLLADGAAKALTSWTFSPCGRSSSDCEYPMSVRFILWGDPIDVSQCKTEFQFNHPGRIVMRSRRALAIRD